MQTSAKLNEEKAPGCADGCKSVITCWKPCLYSQPQIALAPLVKTQAACVTGVKEPQPLAYTPGTGRFVIGFCGSGTGHLTQSLAVLRMLQARGMTLAGIVFDTDATQKMVQARPSADARTHARSTHARTHARTQQPRAATAMLTSHRPSQAPAKSKPGRDRSFESSPRDRAAAC